MQSHVFTLSSHLTAQKGLEELRKKAQVQSIFYIYCTNEKNKLMGVISLRELTISPTTKRISEMIQQQTITVKPHQSCEEVASIIAQYDFIAVPVVDDENHLLGVVTADDVVDMIQTQMTKKLYAQAGLQKDDRIFHTHPTKSPHKASLDVCKSSPSCLSQCRRILI